MTTSFGMRSRLIIASALVLAIQLGAAEPTSKTPTTKFYDLISGEWNTGWCEYSGVRIPKSPSVTSLTVNPDTIVMSVANGESKTLKYELFHGKDGWVVDLYPTYGDAKEWLFPSRISVENGKLKIMLPFKGEAIRRRPDSLDSRGNPDWIVLHLIRSNVATESEVTDEQ